LFLRHRRGEGGLVVGRRCGASERVRIGFNILSRTVRRLRVGIRVAGVGVPIPWCTRPAAVPFAAIVVLSGGVVVVPILAETPRTRSVSELALDHSRGTWVPVSAPGHRSDTVVVSGGVEARSSGKATTCPILELVVEKDSRAPEIVSVESLVVLFVPLASALKKVKVAFSFCWK
jgi:hypothetical protein